MTVCVTVIGHDSFAATSAQRCALVYYDGCIVLFHYTVTFRGYRYDCMI